MTNPVTDVGTRELDFTGDSIQLTTRKGADIIWTHRFQDQDDRALPINNWSFVEPGTMNSTGSVRNGADATTGAPLLSPIDIRKIDSEQDSMNTITDIPIAEVEYILANQNLNIIFPSGAVIDPVPANMFFRLIAGVFQFEFASADVLVGSNAWQIIGPTAIDTTTGMAPTTGFTDDNMGMGYTMEQRRVPFDFVDAIQCYFETSTLDNVNPSSGRSNNAPFEIEALIGSTGLVKSDGSPIVIRQVVASGIVTVFSDVYTAPSP